MLAPAPLFGDGREKLTRRVVAETSGEEGGGANRVLRLPDLPPRLPRRSFSADQGEGSTFAGSTGFPWRRTSKCSLTWSVSVEPISAIFWPFFTSCCSFTRMLSL